MKRTPLRRHTPLRRSIAHDRQVERGRRQNPKFGHVKRGQYRKQRVVAMERATGVCEARLEGVCDGPGCHAHHVLPRSAGGTNHADNLAWLCSACHAHIHAHPAWAYETGWLRRRTA